MISILRKTPFRPSRISILIAFLLFPGIGTGRAGDILRGGAPATPTSRPGITSSGAGSLAPPVATAQDTMARTAQTIQAMQAMQAAARTTARNGPNNLGVNPFRPTQPLPNVANGLAPGGLQIAPGVPQNPQLWVGANLPQQTSANGQTTVTITQNAQQAILNWQTFNIGKETRLTFDQTAGGENASQWIAFNKINDPSGNPSQILGSLDALGQVYVINQNGILFGGSSQINLHTLVASSLPINDNLINRGLLNNPDNQFLFSALPIPAGQNGTPAFTPPAPLTPDGRIGGVIVEKGAQISAPSSSDHVGGRVALIGANATNDGTISTPDGQTIIAGGLQVGFGSHPSGDPSLRGLDVYVGAISDPNSSAASYAGSATNSGLIDAPRANVTIAGSTVNQLGVINSSTSVSLNGRIDLLTNFNAVPNSNTLSQSPPPFLFQSTGLVTFGNGSVTQVLPEVASTERVVGTQLALGSQVNVQGLAIHLDDNAITLAPSAVVTMNAGTWKLLGSGSTASASFVFSDGQIYLDTGAIIDVSGSANVAASVSENIIAAQLLGAELANSPLQRDGPLRGQTIQIDIRQTGTFNGTPWVGTPLADVSGYVNLVQRSVGELTIAGGTVNLNAGNSFVLQPGALINVSGGWIDYQGATVETTKVISNGLLFDISQATPDRLYTGIYTGSTVNHPKWGITETTTSDIVLGAHFEAGYVQGGNGGSINVTAPAMALDGRFLGLTFAGPRQRTTLPTPTSLTLVFQAQDPTPPLFLPYSPTPPNIVFRSNETLTAADPFGLNSSGQPLPLRADRLASVILSPELLARDGFGVLQVTNSDGNITVPGDVLLQTAAGGSITLTGANLDIEGKLLAPGGTLNLTAFELSPYTFARLTANPGSPPPTYDPTRGNFTLGPSGALSAAGLIVDDRFTSPTAGTLPLVTNGGAITIKAFNVDLASGTLIDGSGGVAVNEVGTAKYGSGGRISILAGQDPNAAALFGGHLNLGSTLEAFSGATAGSLTLQAPLIQIGGTASHDNTLLLTPEFFGTGGFGSFTINGLGVATNDPDRYVPGVLIAPGTSLAPRALSWLANIDSGNPITLTPTLLPEGVRTPVSLAFGALGVIDIFRGNLVVVRGDFVMGSDSVIDTDARARVSMSGNTATVLGSATTPGGAISVSGANNSTTFFADQQHALPTVDIGPHASLSTAGEVLLLPDARGFRTGSVLPGGTITVSGNIVAERGSILNVSGTTGILDLPPVFSGQSLSLNGSFAGSPLVPTRVDSNGGTITFKGGQELFTDATLLGAAGGPAAIGGTLNLSSGRFFQPGVATLPTPLDVTMIVTQSGPVIPTMFYPAGDTAIGHAVLNRDGTTAEGTGHFAGDNFNTSGLDSLAIQGTVQFSGPVTLNADHALLIANGGVTYGDGAINLNAPYVALGTAFQPPVQPQQILSAFTVGGEPFYFAPRFGTGVLNVSGQLIDIGNLSLQNIGTANLIARDGDVRGDGTFDIAGNLNITAGQIYPPTETTFTIAAYDYQSGGTTRPGTVTFTAAGQRPLPFSAGGVLNVYASTINQGGILRAPIGTINLGWDGTGGSPRDLITNSAAPIAQQITLGAGSVTSVSAVDPATGEQLIIPFGLNLNGTSWIDPAGTDVTAGGVAAKTINVSAQNVADQGGSIIDIRGGGDLFAYQFVPGTGGTIDILNFSNSFAIVPAHDLGYAPFAPFNPSPVTNNFGNDPGYVNGNLSVGDRIHLDASAGLPEGTYTLLPARYALLPEAFLITPTTATATPNGTAAQPTGATVVPGYRSNGLTNGQTAAPLQTAFEVASSAVVRDRAQYNAFSANVFLKDGALSHDAAVPRLPMDSGRLVLDATRAMSIQGMLASKAVGSGRGGEVDISSPVDIVIGRAGSAAPAGSLFLDAAELSAFGAESLLIGGTREVTSDGTQVTVKTNNLTVDNSGRPLTGSDVILVAKQSLTLAPGADVEQSGSLVSPAETLLFGNENVVGSGNGVLLRVTTDPAADIARVSVNSATTPREVIGAGARITGASVILDSTSNTMVDPSATISGMAVTLDSGQITIQLANAPALQSTGGLVLSGAALQNLQTARFLSLLSYSTIDIYGNGTIGTRDANDVPTAENFALHAGSIRGFNSGGVAAFIAKNITLDNSANASVTAASGTLSGTLEFDAETIMLGINPLRIDRFATLTLNASNGVLLQKSGNLTAPGSINILAPVITAENGADQAITAGGAVTVDSLGQNTTSLTSGLGGSLAINGATIVDNADILLPSGSLTLHATTGDVAVGKSRGTRLDAGGTAQTLFDLVRYTNGGEITLAADAGSVSIGPGSTINVAAQPIAGDAGVFAVSAPGGSFNSLGQLHGAGGTNGRNGTFLLDLKSLATLSALNTTLNASGFIEARSIRVRAGDVLVDGVAQSHVFNLSADQGSIAVSGTIDASGVTGGRINLSASGNLTLQSGAVLTVAAQGFDDAGKGGAISLEAGSETNGNINSAAQLDLRTGSTIDLSVTSNSATSAALGDFTGTLHLRAPQNAAGTDVLIAPINARIVGASSILVEGYKLFDLTATGGQIDDSVKSAVFANGETFAGHAGSPSPTYQAMHDRLLASNGALDAITVIGPGAEIINRTGDLRLGSASSTATEDWDLSTYRFGPRSAPGVLTLRASGNLVFFNALSDGFDPSRSQNNDPGLQMWTAPLLAQNTSLPANLQSWSFRLTSGADLSAADFHRLKSLNTLASTSGSLLLGKNGNQNIVLPPGPSATTENAVRNHFQVIRTGTGDIDISSGRDVQLLNQFATIYTAGTQVVDPMMGGTFDLPRLNASGGENSLGAVQENPAYPAQYSVAGGNVTIAAQNDIIHLTLRNGSLVADSSRELPVNWLYRRGYVDPATGQFGVAKFGDVASTTWWVDFSNFFEGVGALGGGNVTLTAGRDVSNVDAVATTNARMPKGAPDSAKLIELGGGDVTVRAGRDIDGGVYYVERGDGKLVAGNSIHTNSTRSPSLGNISAPPSTFVSQTWLPTTLFAGKASFDVTAKRNLLLGPTANPFLLPEGYSNTYWYKTYFATFAATDTVSVTSLTGDVTLRESVTLPSEGVSAAIPALQAWLQNVLLLPPNTQTPAFYQPWLRLDETNIIPFATVVALAPPALRVNALSGDVNIVGNITLTPSPTGTADVAAAGAINALQVSGVTTVNGVAIDNWTPSTINVSDADPSALPGVASPLAYQRFVGTTPIAAQTGNGFLTSIDNLFRESGSIAGVHAVLQNKQALHAPGVLHRDDLEPVHLYATTGDISGLTLFSPKAARVIAGRDITDIAFYLQNVSPGDFSVVAAGRDLAAYDANSAFRVTANSVGNALGLGAGPLAGDIQIGGPGTLEVLAGRNFDLGIGPNNPDGTAVGITSIGNGRNPSLPFAGATLIVGAGIGPAGDLRNSRLDFATFVSNFLDPNSAGARADRYLPELGKLLSLPGAGNAQVWDAFNALSVEEQDSPALDIFYAVLRDSARDRSNPNSPNFLTYNAGFAAIAALFPGNIWRGDISLTSREIKTANGGNIDVFAPGGSLSVGLNLNSNQAADQGILTEAGGDISIFTRDNVNVGTSRIFTLRGGNEIIWSTLGNIAAGAASKTVQSAPPTRVLIDPQSGDVKTDLAGLATGGGIGVLETVAGVPPSDVDLIAPRGTVDAGDAGIRVSGNLNISAVLVLNAGNIQVGGASAGVPVVAAPNIGNLTTASNTTAAGANAANQVAAQNRAPTQTEEVPSIISVEVLGYGGNESGDDEEERKKKRREQGGSTFL